MANSPGTETLEGPGAGPFVSAWQSEDHVSEQNGAQRVSQCQAEALRKGMEKEKTPTNSPPILDPVESLWESRRRRTRAAQGLLPPGI